MKTRSAPAEPPNIAASVKARRTALIGSPSSRAHGEGQPDDNSSLQVASTSVNEKVDEPQPKSRQAGQKVSFKDVWTADDRRLFFQGLRLYGRNFNELARFIRSRGHRTVASATSATANPSSTSAEASGVNSQSNAPTIVASVAAAAGLLPSNPSNQSGLQSAAVEGRTKEQVRLFYQQTWHKLRRYIKYPDDVPQHVREVYAIINWSAMRFRIKKSLDNRLGEKLNELVHYGSTCVKHNGRRFLLRTPVCPVLKQLNHISAPTQEFTLPDDVWVELVPATQMVAWRVLEAEQNPRLRLKTDINRQLSDVISLAEAKWILPTDLIRSLLCPLGKPNPEESGKVPEKLILRFQKEQRIDGAISVQEVSRARSTDVALNAYLARHRTSQEVLKSTTVDEATGEDVTTAVDNANSYPTATATKASVHVGSSRTGGSCPSTSSTAVNLDLCEVGRQLARGVTFEEARDIKLVVIYLALGCPARIRFEYDIVQSGATRSLTSSSYMPPLSKEAIANGEGITNGLRRLLHLSASEYLNLKNWNLPVRATTTTTTATTTTTTSSQAMKKRSSTVQRNAVPGPSTLPPVQAATSKPASEFAMPACRVPGGHEIFVVNEGQKKRSQMVVARQLNVQRSVVPVSSSVGDAGLTFPLQSPTPRPILPLPMPKVPIPALHSPAGAATGSLPVCKSAAPSLPTNSLHALRTFSQNQARRMRRDRTALSASRRSRFASVPTALPKSLPLPQFPPSSSAHPQDIPSHTNLGVADIAITETPMLPSQSNQGEISLPFSIDACSNVSATDSLKSLLNAFMANAPPGLDLTTPTKDIPQLPSSPNLLHFAPDAQATTDMVHQEDSSSFSTFIKTLTANQPPISHPVEATPISDSFQHKIYQDMLQSSEHCTLSQPLCSEYAVSGADDVDQSISSLTGRMHAQSGMLQVGVIQQQREEEEELQTTQQIQRQSMNHHLPIGFIKHL